MTADTSAAPTRQSLRSGTDPDAHLRTNPMKVALGLVGMIARGLGPGQPLPRVRLLPASGSAASSSSAPGASSAEWAAPHCSSTSSTCSSRVYRDGSREGVIPYAFILPRLLLVGLMLSTRPSRRSTTRSPTPTAPPTSACRTTRRSSATASSGSRSSTTSCGCSSCRRSSSPSGSSSLCWPTSCQPAARSSPRA